MKKLLFLLLLFPLFAMAQVPAAQDTTLPSGTASLNPQFRYKTTQYGRQTYLYNPITGNYDLLIFSKYFRAYAGSGAGTVTSVATSTGILGGPITTTGTLKADTTVLQTVLNFFPKGDTRWLKTTAAASTYVPYTGATGDVTIGAHNISAQAVSVTGTGGAGFAAFPTQSSPPTTPGTGIHDLYTNSSGQFTFVGSNGFGVSLSRALLTASRVYSFPDSTGTLALESRLIPVLSGGTGTKTPALVAGTNITITGSWPNQTITAASGGLTSSNFVLGEVQTVSGGTSTLANTPTSGKIQIVVGGLELQPGVDFTASGATITYVITLVPIDKVQATYMK